MIFSLRRNSLLLTQSYNTNTNNSNKQVLLSIFFFLPFEKKSFLKYKSKKVGIFQQPLVLSDQQELNLGAKQQHLLDHQNLERPLLLLGLLLAHHQVSEVLGVVALVVVPFPLQQLRVGVRVGVREIRRVQDGLKERKEERRS